VVVWHFHDHTEASTSNEPSQVAQTEKTRKLRVVNDDGEGILGCSVSTEIYDGNGNEIPRTLELPYTNGEGYVKLGTQAGTYHIDIACPDNADPNEIRGKSYVLDLKDSSKTITVTIPDESGQG
jgi:hypothetical protein